MKKLLPFLLLIFTTSTFAQLVQDWDISPLGQKTYFERDEGYLEMYYNDSTEVFTDYRKHYFGKKYYREAFGDCYEEVRDHVNNFFDDIFHPSLEERFLLEEWYSNDGFFYVLNGMDTIKFFHKAPVDFEWTMHIQYTNFDSIKVKCKSIVMEAVLGIMDSVRVYEIQTYNNSFPNGSSFNERDIKLSKKFGWVSFTPFYSWIKGVPSWRTNDEEFHISGWEKDGIQEGVLPNFNMFFEAYQEGDIFKWHEKFQDIPESYSRWSRDSITSLNFLDDSLLTIIYNSEKINISWGYNNDTTFSSLTGVVKNYNKNDFRFIFETPPGYPFFEDGSIWELEPIQKKSSEPIQIKTNQLEWFDPFDCISTTTETTREYYYIADIGLYYWDAQSTFFLDWYKELVGYKRNGITTGNIDLEYCALPTSSLDILKSEIKIHPTPTTDFLHFDFSNYKNKIFKITIYDALGNVLLEKQEDLTNPISVSNFPNGFYFVKISSSFGDMIHKLMKH